MPTGYTASVQDGDITELADYALTCARGFGAMVLLRDSDQSLEATRRYVEEQAYAESSSYYVDALRKSRERLAELRSTTDEQALAAAQAAHDEVVASNERHERKRVTELARYKAMIEKVEAWEPPTEDHVEFKKFMLDQLRGSVEFDCRSFSMPAPEVSLAWRDEEIERELRNVQRYEEEIEKEAERNAGRVAWVTALLDSLEGVPA